MKILFSVLIGLLFLFKPVPANTQTENNIHLIIAFDVSLSMRISAYSTWASVGGVFFYEYFADYTSRCQVLTIDFIAWGKEALPPIHRRLTSESVSLDYAELLYAAARLNMQGTKPRSAMLAANSLVEDGFDRTVIIIISDADYVGEGNSELWRLVAPTTEFTGISLGSAATYDYFARHLIPKHGQQFHANNAREFKQILTGVLDGFGYDFCMGG